MTYRQLPGYRPLLSERNKSDSAKVVLWCIAAGAAVIWVSALAFWMDTEPPAEVVATEQAEIVYSECEPSPWATRAQR